MGAPGHGPIGGGRGRGKGFSAAVGSAAPPAGTKVYVGNLSWETSWQDLKDHFRSAGEVLHADVMQGADGRSKGCGLVTFTSAHDAARAISDLHDSVLHSRSIFVREDREAALPGLPAPAGRGSGAAPPAGMPPPPQRSVGAPPAVGVLPAEAGTKVFVSNLAFETSWQDLKDHFRTAGEVLHADVMQGADGRSKGCGLVTFNTAREAANAMSTLNQTSIGGRVIFVREDREAAPQGLPAPASRSSPAGPVGSAAAAPPPPFGGLPPARNAPARTTNGVAAAAPAPVAGAPAAVGNKVYVGNLAWETSWQVGTRTHGGRVNGGTWQLAPPCPVLPSSSRDFHMDKT